jgi:hypothetical protein
MADDVDHTGGDPVLALLLKAMQLNEELAAKEMAKGPKADVRKAARLMIEAADIGKDIADVMDRRGLAPKPIPKSIQVELVGPSSETAARAYEQENFRLQDNVRQLERELWDLKQPGGRPVGDPPADPMRPVLALPPPSDPALRGSATQSGAAPKTPAETGAQRIARLRWDAGDRPQALRAPFDNGYGRDFGLSGGATRFDNKVPLP